MVKETKDGLVVGLFLDEPKKEAKVDEVIETEEVEVAEEKPKKKATKK